MALSLTRRVWAVVALLWAVLAVSMGVAVQGLVSARDSLASMKVRLEGSNRMATISEALLDNRLQLLLAFQHDPASPLARLHDHPMKAHLDATVAGARRVEVTWASLKGTLDGEEELRLAEAAERARAAWVEKLGATRSALEQGDFSPEAMQALLVAGRTEGVKAVQAMEALEEEQVRRGLQAQAEAEARYHRALLVFLGIFVLGVLPSVVITLLAMRRLTRGLRQANAVADAIAQGDLRDPGAEAGGDEIGTLLTSMAAMREHLVDIIRGVRSGSDHIATASSQVASGAGDLAQRTEKQAGQVQETAAAVEELTSAVQVATERATSADQEAAEAAGRASRGEQAMVEVVATMGRISEASKKIEEIVTVIDEIAFQTNILALNASVEAARAGEHGRGFGVVATEVRSLAQRAATSAREVRELIGTSVESVASGTQQVTHAGAQLKEVLERIQRVAHLVNEIALASKEQSAGLDHINTAVAGMEQNSQQNAAMVEQTSAATAALSTEARTLAEAVSRFSLN